MIKTTPDTKYVSLTINIFQDDNESIHITSNDVPGFHATVNDKPTSIRHHPKLFEKFKAILVAEDRWT